MTGRSPDNEPSMFGAAPGPRSRVGHVDSSAASVDISDPDALLSRAAAASLLAEARAAVGQLGRSGEIRVRLVSDAEMAAAHLKFSNIPGTTDVLTFDLSEGATARGEPLDVDIIACVDEAKRQAAERSHTVERELLLYILHGALHCLGHDDHDDDAFQRMHAEEDRILNAIGVGPLFSGTGVPARDPIRGTGVPARDPVRGTGVPPVIPRSRPEEHV
jgi:probable rRNA maturation factor